VPVTLAQWTAHKRRQRNPIWPSARIFWNDFAIFAVVCAGGLSVNLVGSLPGNEILILFLLPYLAMTHGSRAFRREYMWFWILLGGWLFGTIGGDLYLGTVLASKLKGIARVLFLGIDFAALAILIDKKVRGYIVFLLGDAVLLFVGALKFGGGSIFTEWKYGLDGAVGIPAILVAAYFFGKRRYSIAIAIALGVAMLNLRYAVRSQVAIDLMTAAVMLPIAGTRKSKGGRAFDGMAFFKLLMVLALTGGAAYAANQVIKYAVSQNFFNEEIENKFSAQSSGQLGVLVGGRPETLVAIQAIIDNPIIGHGSFAVDEKYLQLMQDIQYKYNYSDSDQAEDADVPSIPTHSHLTQAWVESGIMGGIFWLYVLGLVGLMFVQTILRRPAMTPIYAGFAVGFTWDVLYSPMGSTDRLIAAFMILLCLDLVHQWSAKPALSRRPPAAQVLPKTTVSFSRGWH
jgi:O-antigen ligase